MKTYTSTVDEDGVLLLPAEFCHDYDWLEGDTLSYTDEDDAIVIKNVSVLEREKDLHIIKIEKIVTSYYAVKTNAATGRYNALDAASILDNIYPIAETFGEPTIVECEKATSTDVRDLLVQGGNTYFLSDIDLIDVVVNLND
jgi:bifunctional DNA-binding transcriptional regulator/antitoxin component of YhaV-PrlF toxin-antitoxin module